MNKIAALLTISLFPFITEAQSNFKVEHSTERILIGDQFTLNLSASVHKNDAVIWPTPPEELGSGLFVGRSGIDTIFSGAEMKLSETWTLTSFDSAFVVIPPIEIKVNGEPIASDPILVQVDMPNSASQDYYDIVEPRGIEHPVWKFYLAGLFALVALFFSARAVVRTIRSSAQASKALDPRSYEERVLDELNELRASSNTITAEGKDEFYKKATQILFTHLRVKLGINTAKGQPEDWVKTLDKRGDFNGDTSEILNFINHIQSVRFGHANLSEEDHLTWLEKLRSWIIESQEPVHQFIKEEEHELVE